MRARPPRRFLREFLVVLGGLLLVSAAIRAFDLDLAVARRFYRPGLEPAFWAKGRQPWDALYRYGVWPANLAAIGAFLILVGSLFRPIWLRHRRNCLVLVLVLALGPGLLVNAAFKDYWGRPRPRDLVEFGGDATFRPVGSADFAGPGRAFPSGHASMGFYFLTLYILWRRSNPRNARLALAGGLAAGALIGFQRIASGAHFLSDVLWAGGIDYLVALAVDRVVPARASVRGAGLGP